MHAPIAMSALQLGKNVYCQKPLTHDLYEARKLTEFARFKGVVTQMGIQIHSSSFYRLAALLMQAGTIGRVKEVHSWVGSRLGRSRAASRGVRSRARGLQLGSLAGGLCQAAVYRQGVLSSGQLAQAPRLRHRLSLGDMACHLFDPVFMSLELTAPISVRSEGTGSEPVELALGL